MPTLIERLRFQMDFRNDEPGLVGLLGEAADSLTRLEARVGELEKEAEWQPIETAPREKNKPLLGWVPSYYQGKGGHSVILWFDNQWFCNDAAHPTDPTHWRPLPNPPKELPNAD